MTVLGVDVSSYQGNPNWAQVRAGGYAFAIIKATEGTSYVNPGFTPNLQAAQANGVLASAYHFASPNGGPEDGRAEAEFFCGVVRRAGSFTLPPVLDLESGSGNLGAWALAFLTRTQELLGVRPLLYSYRPFIAAHLASTPELATFDLWVAAYTQANSPGSTAPWGARWLFWQYTSGGSVPGISGKVDVDRFAGSEAELRALVGAPPAPPAPTPVPVEGMMAGTCIPSWAKRGSDSRAPAYRLLPGAGPNDARVLAYNGAPLVRKDGTGYGIPFMDVKGLAAKPIDVVEIESTGAIVIFCEDGGEIDVAAKP